MACQPCTGEWRIIPNGVLRWDGLIEASGSSRRLSRAKRQYSCGGCVEPIQVGELHGNAYGGAHFCLPCWQLYIARSLATCHALAEARGWREGKRALKTIHRMLNKGLNGNSNITASLPSQKENDNG